MLIPLGKVTSDRNLVRTTAAAAAIEEAEEAEVFEEVAIGAAELVRVSAAVQ